MRRTAGDARRGEALYYVVLTTLAAVLLLAHVAAWTVLHPSVEAAPGGAAALRLWALQLGTLLLVVGAGLVGVRPRVTVAVDERGVTARQGRRTAFVAHADVRRAEPLSALRFHRHEARYAATRAFVCGRPATLLALDTPAGPLVLGLPPADHGRLTAALEAARTASGRQRAG